MNNHKNIKVTVTCLPDCEIEIKKMFFDILNDYCNRFNVGVTDKIVKVNICLIEYDEDTKSEGLTTVSDDLGKIIIQMRDPFMNDWEPNPYTVSGFVCILAHEMVHACQFLTGRNGFKIPKLAWNKNDVSEKYFFDPMEIEARVLEVPYAQLYGKILHE